MEGGRTGPPGHVPGLPQESTWLPGPSMSLSPVCPGRLERWPGTQAAGLGCDRDALQRLPWCRLWPPAASEQMQ